jgi:hypothetical protein
MNFISEFIGGIFMSAYITRITLRVDETLFKKLKFIAEKEKRSANAQIEFAIEKLIFDYESQHGEIEVNTDELYK